MQVCDISQMEISNRVFNISNAFVPLGLQIHLSGTWAICNNLHFNLFYINMKLNRTFYQVKYENN